MNKEKLIIPAEYVARGLVSPEMLEQQRELRRTHVSQRETAFPTAMFPFDDDKILRVNADNIKDAGELNHALNGLSFPFTPYEVTVG